MNQSQILQTFKDCGALLQGHFLLSSGLHSKQYLQCARVLEDPRLAQKLCLKLAEHFRQEHIDVVLGPAMGGIILAYELARALGARALFSERICGKMQLRRGFSLSSQDKALIAEDVITTGDSVKEVIELVKAQGAQLVSVCALADRSQPQVDFGSKYISLLRLEIENYPPEDCPLCKQQIAVVKPGSK